MTDLSVSASLADLERLDRNGLAERWEVAFGHPPPPRVHASLLRLGLAWHVQIKAQTDWTAPKIRRMLASASSGDAVLQVGTRLVREWQGVTHQVAVLPSGFEYEGSHYRSLTSIARQITGMSWSGPAFFGLKS